MKIIWITIFIQLTMCKDVYNLLVLEREPGLVNVSDISPLQYLSKTVIVQLRSSCPTTENVM